MPLANSFRSMNLQVCIELSVECYTCTMFCSHGQRCRRLQPLADIQQQVPREVDILMGCETGAMPLPGLESLDGLELSTPRPHHQPYSTSVHVAVQPCAPEYTAPPPAPARCTHFTPLRLLRFIHMRSLELWLCYLYLERTYSSISIVLYE